MIPHAGSGSICSRRISSVQFIVLGRSAWIVRQSYCMASQRGSQSARKTVKRRLGRRGEAGWRKGSLEGEGGLGQGRTGQRRQAKGQLVGPAGDLARGQPELLGAGQRPQRCAGGGEPEAGAEGRRGGWWSILLDAPEGLRSCQEGGGEEAAESMRSSQSRGGRPRALAAVGKRLMRGH